MTLLIFECDGVLVDSEFLANAALAELMSALGYQMATPEQAVKLFTGLRLKDVLASAEALPSFPIPADLGANGSWNDFGVSSIRSKVFAKPFKLCHIGDAFARHPRARGFVCRSKYQQPKMAGATTVIASMSDLMAAIEGLVEACA